VRKKFAILLCESCQFSYVVTILKEAKWRGKSRKITQ